MVYGPQQVKIIEIIFPDFSNNATSLQLADFISCCPVTVYLYLAAIVEEGGRAGQLWGWAWPAGGHARPAGQGAVSHPAQQAHANQAPSRNGPPVRDFFTHLIRAQIESFRPKI